MTLIPHYHEYVDDKEEKHLPRATGVMARLARQKRRSAVERAASRQLNTDLISLITMMMVMTMTMMMVMIMMLMTTTTMMLVMFSKFPNLLRRTASAVVFPIAPTIPI